MEKEVTLVLDVGQVRLPGQASWEQAAECWLYGEESKVEMEVREASSLEGS